MTEFTTKEAKAITEAARYVWANAPCLLCDSEKTMMGALFNTREEIFGCPEGKERFIPYTLCKRCYEHGEANPDFRTRKIESILIQRMKNMLGIQP